jgi:hypothetical protein
LAGSLQIDHIIPRSDAGSDLATNLCCCCSWCNLRKGDRVFARDPDTNRRMRIFHPRKQRWSDHFRWTPKGTRIKGLTPCGRATIVALQLNHSEMLYSRRWWIKAGWHPPPDNLG